MAYADYEFYLDVYKGDVLTNEDSDLWLERASQAVKRATRSQSDSALTEFQTERVKFAVCLTADYLSSIGDTATAGTVSSYSIGDVSVSLSDGDKLSVERYGVPQRAYDELIQTGLLYVGVR